MGLVQLHYRGRADGALLNSDAFEQAVDTGWTQQTDHTFRVRFEVEEDNGAPATVTGGLEAQLDGRAWFAISTASGTVTAAASTQGIDGASTVDVLAGSGYPFAVGYGSIRGSVTPVQLAGQHTELEYALRISSAAPSGGTVRLRVAGLDSYPQVPAITVSNFTTRDQVRLKIGDTDMTDPLLSDAEIDVCLAAWPTNVDLAASVAAEAVAARFSRGYNFSTDGQVFNRRERVQHYMDLARALRRAGYLVWPSA